MSAAFSGPALAFCGYSGSGKTELLLNCLNLLKERGFSPAVLRTSSEVHAEIASKDSQRFLTKVLHWSASRIPLKSSYIFQIQPLALRQLNKKLNFVD